MVALLLLRTLILFMMVTTPKIHQVNSLVSTSTVIESGGYTLTTVYHGMSTRSLIIDHGVSALTMEALMWLKYASTMASAY